MVQLEVKAEDLGNQTVALPIFRTALYIESFITRQV